MVLSKDQMISQEQAEQELVAKQPAIDQAHQRLRRREECITAADGNKEDSDDDKEALLSLPTPSTLPHTFLDDLDDGKPLSADNNNNDNPFGFFEMLPIPSSSRHQL